jgi:biopolymer transport protein TolR
VGKDQLALSVKAALQAAPAAASAAVVISADKNVKYETVVRVMDTLQRAGVPRVGLSVQLAP